MNNVHSQAGFVIELFELIACVFRIDSVGNGNCKMESGGFSVPKSAKKEKRSVEKTDFTP